uniref:Uncharacterized protein n=1 Tax=Glossina austeni TaxID=7395 RepID=A0A1A9VLS9_GLOAU
MASARLMLSRNCKLLHIFGGGIFLQDNLCLVLTAYLLFNNFYLKERPQTDKMDKRKISLLYGTDSQSKRLERYNGRGFLQQGVSARAVDLSARRMDSPGRCTNNKPWLSKNSHELAIIVNELIAYRARR